MSRVQLVVGPAGQRGGWKLTKGGRRVTGHLRKSDTVRDAVVLAKALVVQGGKVSLRIKGRDGRIQEERTYPRSSDPRRTKG